MENEFESDELEVCVGDRVRHETYGNGTIKKPRSISNSVCLVDFDLAPPEYLGPHDGLGLCKEGCGLWISKTVLKLIPKYILKPSIKPDRELVINEEDEINLQIALNTAKTFEDFLAII